MLLNDEGAPFKTALAHLEKGVDAWRRKSGSAALQHENPEAALRDIMARLRLEQARLLARSVAGLAISEYERGEDARRDAYQTLSDLEGRPEISTNDTNRFKAALEHLVKGEKKWWLRNDAPKLADPKAALRKMFESLPQEQARLLAGAVEGVALSEFNRGVENVQMLQGEFSIFSLRGSGISF